MRILIYGINYAPELTGIGKYTGEMGAWLARQGHTVRVITGMPYYPEWEIHRKYKWKLWHTEKVDGVTVYRCPLYVPRKVTSLKRIIHEFSFLAGILPIWFKTLFQKKYDTVICVSPPFHLGFLPLLYSKLKGVNLITHIQDLQVDAAKNLVMIKNGRFLNMMFGAEKFILKKSTAVSTISTGMLKRIKDKNIEDAKIILFPNWVDTNTIKPLSKEQSLRKEYGLTEKDKVILYSGNLGEKQGLDILIEVAKDFTHKPDVHFLIIGSGGNKEKLEKLVAKNNLNNIRFFPLVPNEKLPALLASADLHLVLQKKSASDLVMPSKLTGILAAGGRPVVTAEPGTSLYEMIETHKLGILVKPESPVELSRAIETALATDLSLYRQHARQYAVDYLSRDSIMKKFEMEIYSRLKKSPVLSYVPASHSPNHSNVLSIKKR